MSSQRLLTGRDSMDRKSSPVKMTPSNLGQLESNSSSPFKSSSKLLGTSDREKLVRHQLSQIDSYLDIQKLI
jgi:hypothetical protein